MAESERIIAVVGPTASGKTSLAIELCKIFNGEVVSCDSMQIYKEMQIATATPTEEEMCGIKHHLISFVSPAEEFSVARYCEYAKDCIDDIVSRGKMPVIVGGTGLYFNSLIDNIQFFEEHSDGTVRDRLKLRAEKFGIQSLLDELFKIDPETAQNLHINNQNRIIRALEVYELTGRTLSETKRLSRLEKSKYDPIIIGLDAENRDCLYDRINQRVDLMISNGIIDEARSFYNKYSGKTSTQAIGYKELKPFLDGEKTLDECVEQLKLSSRHYAKRQLTWFRKDERIKFFMIDKYDSSQQLIRAVACYIKEMI